MLQHALECGDGLLQLPHSAQSQNVALEHCRRGSGFLQLCGQLVKRTVIAAQSLQSRMHSICSSWCRQHTEEAGEAGSRSICEAASAARVHQEAAGPAAVFDPMAKLWISQGFAVLEAFRFQKVQVALVGPAHAGSLEQAGCLETLFV